MGKGDNQPVEGDWGWGWGGQDCCWNKSSRNKASFIPKLVNVIFTVLKNILSLSLFFLN